MTTTGRSVPPPPVKAGRRVRVTQAVIGRDKTWTTRVEGVVESCRPEPTGSWFAHGRNDRLWLWRLRVRKPDGEITDLVVDANTRIERLD